MRYSVTALGSTGDRPVGVVVGTIARYLVAPEPSPLPGARSPGGGAGEGSVVRYYADRGDTPGRWVGQGARELGLAGEVDFDDFTSVLAGRDPRTGARGSAGRVASLGTGTVARWGPNGEAHYSARDAARILGWTPADVRAAGAEGAHLAASRLVGTLTGQQSRPRRAPRERPGTDRAAIPAGTGTPAPAHPRGTDTGKRPGERDGSDGTTTNLGGLHGHDRDGHPGRDARRGTDRERTGQRSRPGPGHRHPHIGTGNHTGGRPGRTGNEPEQRPGDTQASETATGNPADGPMQTTTASGRRADRAGSEPVATGTDRDDFGIALVPLIEGTGPAT